MLVSLCTGVMEEVIGIEVAIRLELVRFAINFELRGGSSVAGTFYVWGGILQ